MNNQDLGRSTARFTAPLLLSMAVVGLSTVTGLLVLDSAPQTLLYGMMIAVTGLGVWHLTYRARPVAFTLLALATVAPEYVVEVQLAWDAAAPSSSGRAPLALAAVTGASGVLVGLAWPVVIILHWVKSGGGTLSLESGQRRALWFLLLADLYAFTIYLKGFLTVLDTFLLVLLFGACVWTVWRRQEKSRDLNAAARATEAVVHRRKVATGVLVCLAAGIAAGTMLVADALVIAAQSIEGDPFDLVQSLVPVASKSPLLVILAVLVWKARPAYATSMLITSQTFQLTVLLGSLPMAYLLNGFSLGHVATFALDDRQSAELLLTSAQSLFLIVVVARMNVSPKGALTLMVLFTLQSALSTLELSAGSTLAQTVPAAVYLSAVTVLISGDRTRLQFLLEVIPSRERGPHRPKTNIKGAESR